jgi:hypothetical protein
VHRHTPTALNIHIWRCKRTPRYDGHRLDHVASDEKLTSSYTPAAPHPTYFRHAYYDSQFMLFPSFSRHTQLSSYLNQILGEKTNLIHVSLEAVLMRSDWLRRTLAKLQNSLKWYAPLSLFSPSPLRFLSVTGFWAIAIQKIMHFLPIILFFPRKM